MRLVQLEEGLTCYLAPDTVLLQLGLSGGTFLLEVSNSQANLGGEIFFFFLFLPLSSSLSIGGVK